jgi:CMP/dCMP kinase
VKAINPPMYGWVVCFNLSDVSKRRCAVTVLTISRQYGSGGDEIADQVGEALGYRHFDKRLMAQAAAEAGLSEQEVIDYSEDGYKVQTFLDRLFGRSRPVAQVRVWKEGSGGVRSAEELKLSEDAALALVQRAVKATYHYGNMIIVGRGGQILLKDQPNVFHVRIVAPMEERVQRVKTQLKTDQRSYQADIDARRIAQDLIWTRDAASADYIKRFYGVDWDDPLLYHLVLNTGKITFEQATQLLVDWVHKLEPVLPTAV